MNCTKWIAHFNRNRKDRPEPEWSAPRKPIPSEVLAPLVRSLEQFQLGDGGGPASLIAFDAERYRSSTDETRTLVDLWFDEEKEHARLLGCAVDRFGGRRIKSHWSFTAFCLCRRVSGVRFELQILLLTELVSTAYYRVLRRHSPDAPLAAMCALILRDEAGHVAFHRDRLAAVGRSPLGLGGRVVAGAILALRPRGSHGAVDEPPPVPDSHWRFAHGIFSGSEAPIETVHSFTLPGSGTGHPFSRCVLPTG